MRNKEKNGITLIALVVSIIVMLILAGTSINLAFGEHGIITMTLRARDAYLKGEDIEIKAIEGHGKEIEDAIE